MKTLNPKHLNDNGEKVVPNCDKCGRLLRERFKSLQCVSCGIFFDAELVKEKLKKLKK